jgi:hypothetical protein
VSGVRRIEKAPAAAIARTCPRSHRRRFLVPDARLKEAISWCVFLGVVMATGSMPSHLSASHSAISK